MKQQNKFVLLLPSLVVDRGHKRTTGSNVLVATLLAVLRVNYSVLIKISSKFVRFQSCFVSTHSMHSQDGVDTNDCKTLMCNKKINNIVHFICEKYYHIWIMATPVNSITL